MLFDSNPIIRSLHNHWKESISDNFQEYFESREYLPLLLIKYINDSPQKYYCRKSFNEYFSFLNDLKKNNIAVLHEIMKENNYGFSNANIVLLEVNDQNFHEKVLPIEHVDCIDFVEQVHYWLLRLYEGALKPMIYPIAKNSRLSRGKSCDCLKIVQCIDELQHTKFYFIMDSFSRIVRNGIAHGDISYFNHDIIYRDDKGNEEIHSPKEILSLFDNILDICNGFMCSIKVFYFETLKELAPASFPISLLFEELQFQANSPGWKILKCIESSNINSTKQLNIYVQNDFWSPLKVLWGCYYIAYWSIKLIKQYERVFISLKSSHSSNGWADFDGTVINKNINLEPNESLDWLKEVNKGGIMFKPYYKFPKIFYKIGTWRSIFNSQFRKLRENSEKNNAKFIIKDSKHHTKKHDLIIENASVIIYGQDDLDVKSFIKENHKKIVRKTIKSTRKNYSVFSLKKYYPVKVFRIFIFDTDQRIRNRQHAGLVPELIAAISYNDKKYRFPDLLQCEKEIFRKNIIFWHLGWKRGNNESY